MFLLAAFEVTAREGVLNWLVVLSLMIPLLEMWDL